MHDAESVSEDLVSEFGPEMLPTELGGISAAPDGDDLNARLLNLESYFIAVRDSTGKSKK